MALALTALAAHAATPDKLDPQIPCQAQRANSVTYDVDFAVVVTAPEHTKILKVWLPLPPSDFAQQVEHSEINTFPMTVTPKIGKEELFGNQFAYFEFHQPRGGQVVRHRFKIKVWELHWNVEPARVDNVARWPTGFDRYLRSDRVVMVDGRFQKLAKEIVHEGRGPVRDLADVMGWVSHNVSYDHAFASLRASSEHALLHKKGHCSDYHGLCAALGRALGYPTRVAYGIHAFPKNSPSHCKLEAFLPPYGWVSFDVSETQRLVETIKKSPELDQKAQEHLCNLAHDRLQRGYRDNTWFLQTIGTDYELAPPAVRKVPIVRTIYAEADGVALPDPDPANPEKRELAWMTVHQYRPDRPVSYPFKDWKSLERK